MRQILLVGLIHITVIGHLIAQESDRPNLHRVVITSSWITIHGETNVNNFHCTLNKSSKGDHILVRNVWSNQKLDFEEFILKYKVEDFECGLNAMNNDFKEILKAEEVPFLTLQLNSITINPENAAFENLDVDAEVEVSIAGIKRKIQVIDGKVHNHTPAHLTLMGRKKLLMTDFELEPPTKFLGMVKVMDDIEIEFEISMEVKS